MNELERRATTSDGDSQAAVQRSPGKRTLVQRLAAAASARPLQREARPEAAAPSRPVGDDPFGLHLEGGGAQAIAARGVEGGGGPLPHHDAIAASFGRHDVGDVRAHVGGAAAEAAGALGAEAYATGGSVAFRAAPSLHTAAHEAAHVVQQRAGVALKGGVGEAGDPYERHADAVADAVVAGRSAEALLDQAPGGGGGGGGVQRQEADAAPPPEPAADAGGAPAADGAAAPAAEEEGEGDRLRKAILGGAEQRLKDKTEIVSQAKVDEIRAGGMKNFTTCIEFAGQTMRDGAKAAGGNAKESTKLAMLLPQFMQAFQKETGLGIQIATFEKAAHRFDKPLADAVARIEKLDGEMAELEAKAGSGDKNADARTAAQLKQKRILRKAIEGQVKTLTREQERWLGKVDKLKAELEAVQEKNEAWIKPTPGMTNGRPKPGEYVLTGAGSAQDFGVAGAPKVTLAKGSFKHIAVLQSIGKAPSPPDKPDEEWEEWHTIDGGGLTPKATTVFVRLSDAKVQQQSPGTPWAQSSTVVLGWVDMNKLVEQGLHGTR